MELRLLSILTVLKGILKPTCSRKLLELNDFYCYYYYYYYYYYYFNFVN